MFKISFNIKIISSARRESTTFLFFHIDDVISIWHKMAPVRRSLVSCEQMTEKLIQNSVLDILNLIPFSIVNCGHLLMRDQSK